MAEKEGFGFRASASPCLRFALRTAYCHENAGRENASLARFLIPPVQIPRIIWPQKGIPYRNALLCGGEHGDIIMN